MGLWHCGLCIGEGGGAGRVGGGGGVGGRKPTVCTEWQECSSKCVPKCELLCTITVSTST